MIYGNKFLDNNLSITESVIIKEEQNINLLFNDLNVLSEVNIDRLGDKIYDTIFDKIEEFFDRIRSYISKFIDFIKLKILKLGNKILKKIDESINNKFEIKDLPDIENEYKKDFDNGGEYREIIESVITESDSVKKITFVSIKNPRTLSDKTEEYINNAINLADDFMSNAEKYLSDSIEFLKGNNSDTIKNKLESYHDYFTDDIYNLVKESEKNELIYNLMYDIKELKSTKSEQGFTTTNNFFNVDLFDISDIEKLKELRSMLLSQIKYLENQIEVITKHKRNLDKIYLKTKSFYNKASRELRYNGIYDKNYQSTKFDSKNSKYLSIHADDVRSISNYLTKIISNDYKACSNFINASIYVTRNNYKTAIQAIKLWGESKSDESK